MAQDLTKFLQPVEDETREAPEATDAQDLSEFLIPVEAEKKVASDPQDLSAFLRPVEEETSTLDDVIKGVQRGVAPTTLSKEEFKESSSATEIASQVGTEIAAAAAVAAAGGKIGAAFGAGFGGVGAIPGAAIGTLVSTIGYALYKGIAGESAASEAYDRDFNPLYALGGVGVEINPVFKGGKIARGLRQAGAQALEAHGQSDGDMTTTAIAGALGGTMVGLTKGQSELFDNIAVPQAFRRPSNPTGTLNATEILETAAHVQKNGDDIMQISEQLLVKRGGEDYLQMPDNFLESVKSGKRLSATHEDLIRSATMRSGAKVDKELRKKFVDEMSTLNEAGQAKLYKKAKMNMVLQDAGAAWSKKAGKELTDGLEDPLETESLTGWLKTGASAPVFVARKYDEQLDGLNLTGAHSNISHATRAFENAAGPYIDRAKNIDKITRKMGLDRERLGRGLAGKLDDATAEETVVINKWRGFYDDLGDYLRSKDLQVGHLEDYFPQQTQTPAALRMSLDTEAKKLNRKFPNQDLNEIPEAADLMATLRHIKKADDSAVVVAMDEVQDLIKSVTKPQVYKKVAGFEGSAAFRRRGEMPEFIRDYDPGRAAMSYINSNLKPIHLNDAFRQLQANITILRGAGMEEGAKYWDKHLASMSGQPSNLKMMLDSSIQNWKFHTLKAEARATTTTSKNIAKAQGFLPDFLSWSSTLIYPNHMGYNLHSPIRNLTQPWLLTAPEVGEGGYGYKLTGRATLQSVKALRQMDAVAREGIQGEQQINRFFAFDKMNKVLRDEGYKGGTFVGEGESIIMDSLRNIPGVGKLVEVVEQLGKIGMTAYGGSDTANRFVTLHVGKNLAEDFTKNVPQAIAFAKKLPAGRQAELRAVIRKGSDEKEVARVFTDHLMDITQYNYDKNSLSQFGQQLGRVATMFTKWPTMVIGDMADIKRTHNIAKLMSKYVAPMAALQTVDMILDDMDAMDNPAMKLMYGRGALSASPVGSAFIGLPPLVKAPLTAIEAAKAGIMDGDPGKALDKAIDTVKPFMPGGFVPVAGKRVIKAFEGD